MKINFSFYKSSKKSSGAIVAFTTEKKSLPDSVKALDNKCDGYIKDAVKASSGFSGENHEILILPLPKKAEFTHLLLISLGDGKDKSRPHAIKTGAKLFQELHALKVNNVLIHIEKTALSGDSFAAHLAHGMELRAYRFDKYHHQKDKSKNPDSLTCEVVLEAHSSAKDIHSSLNAVTQGVNLARDLVNEPANVLYPESYADIIKKELSPLGVKVEILDNSKLEKLGMGAILAVGMGSARPPRMVVMRWEGAPQRDEQPLGFVGKGVTFDTGGISIKPSSGMDEMKMDMGGSGAVVGLMKALATQKVKRNVVAIVGLAENMPSERAFRPGDIIKSYKGKYIEVLNTDAEGRLVLADCLTYIQEKYDPKFIIDLATLTGAIMIALGHEYSGAFVNDDKLWTKLETASKDTGEKLWRMPLDEQYRKDVESDIGDVRNVGKTDRLAGSCTAAAFLEHFIDKDRPWCHLDIAGTAWSTSDQDLHPKGASGVGVRVLAKYVENL